MHIFERVTSFMLDRFIESSESTTTRLAADALVAISLSSAELPIPAGCARADMAIFEYIFRSAPIRPATDGF